MLIFNNTLLLKQKIKDLRYIRKKIGLVPTMGNLHNGHMKLIDKAKSNSDIVIVTIFVNPIQFNQVEDFIKYPRSIEDDYKKISQCNKVDIVFAPQISDIYPNGTKFNTYIEEPQMSNILDGASRPGHFRGVLTIISKLFNLIQPDIACFGEKDYQQLLIIRKMVVDMNYDIKILSVPIKRESDGLAYSSRNNLLTIDQRQIAPTLNKVINCMAKNVLSREFNVKKNINFAKQTLISKGFFIDIIEIRDACDLSELSSNSKFAIILVAAWLGKVRLIDNKIVNLFNSH